MKTIKIFAGIVLGLGILGCNNNKDTELGVTTTVGSTYLINASAQSCSNKVAVFVSPSTAVPSSDVSPYYFSIEGATLSWKNITDTAYIVQMKIEFTSNNITHVCNVTGDELLSVFFDFNTGVRGTFWDGTLAPAASAAAPTTLVSQCKIRCGGVSVADENRAFTTTGSMIITGFQRSPSGDEKPIKARTSVKLIYQ